jgi:hypothetical protein
MAAVPLSFLQPWIACACYAMVAIMWLLPDPRIEKKLGNEPLACQVGLTGVVKPVLGKSL